MSGKAEPEDVPPKHWSNHRNAGANTVRGINHANGCKDADVAQTTHHIPFRDSGLSHFFIGLVMSDSARRNSDFEELGLAVGRRSCRSCDMMTTPGRLGSRPMKLRRSYSRSTATAKKVWRESSGSSRAYFEQSAARGAPSFRKNTRGKRCLHLFHPP